MTKTLQVVSMSYTLYSKEGFVINSVWFKLDSWEYKLLANFIKAILFIRRHCGKP
jgi:hypothetical protein